MRNAIGVLIGCLACIVAAQAEGLYRWVDSEGNVHYGDYPAPDAAQVQEKKFAPGQQAADDDLLPYATRVAKANFPVTLYVGSQCGRPCDNARNFLNKRGIPFTEKLMQTKKDYEELEKLSGSDGLPTLAIGRTYLKGFEQGGWNSELDIAGYPKEAPYGSRPVPPAKAPQPVSAPVPAPESAPLQSEPVPEQMQ